MIRIHVVVVVESRAIVKYLAKKYQGGSCDLLGETVAEEAVVEQWCQVESQQFNPPFYAIIEQVFINPMKGLGSTDDAVVESNVQKLGKVLDVYEERLSKKYLAGNFFSLVDLQHLPYLHYLVTAVDKGYLLSSSVDLNPRLYQESRGIKSPVMQTSLNAILEKRFAGREI